MSSTEGGLELSNDDMKRVGKTSDTEGIVGELEKNTLLPSPLLSRKQPDASPLGSENPFKPMT